MKNSLGDLLIKSAGVLMLLFLDYLLFGMTVTSLVVGIVILAIYRLGL